MAYGLTRKWALFAATAALIAFGGFGMGFVSCLQLKRAASDEVRERRLLHSGDAPPAVRAQVLASLRSFQAGYVKRDPADLDSFMEHLFVKGDQVLIMGTEGGASEWVRGYSAATDFIRTDWRDWGDFRFDVDDSIICSSGDVAWVASIGTVRFHGLKRPIRFTAILSRDGTNWLFRELHFQWDESSPDSSEIFRPSTYRRLFLLALQRLSGH